MTDNKNKPLTLDERRIIETGIRNGSKKTAIADTIGKDKSTVGKEIRLHRTLSHKCHLPLECSSYGKCIHGRNCTARCPDYVPFHCSRRDRSPGACNGCPQYSRCRFDKYTYDAAAADRAYRSLLVDAREGVNLTTAQARDIAAVVGPLLKQGLSPYHIITAHPELGISEKTLYNYIEWHVFDIAGIKDIDLRRKVSRRLPRKTAKTYKKRQDRAFLKGRLFTDYQAYLKEHPQANVVEMDTVYNDVSNGPFIQTFKFLPCGLLVAIYHNARTAADMVEGVDRLEGIIGRELWNIWAEVLLTDRGTEFSDAEGLELRPDGSRRTRVFYCDPMQSGQKGSLEVNHEQLRYILPKEVDLRALGLTGQEPLDVAISNIASVPVESLHGKTPIEYTRFLCPQLLERLEAAGLREIPKDEVVLKPYLLKRFRPV